MNPDHKELLAKIACVLMIAALSPLILLCCSICVIVDTICYCLKYRNVI